MFPSLLSTSKYGKLSDGSPSCRQVLLDFWIAVHTNHWGSAKLCSNYLATLQFACYHQYDWRFSDRGWYAYQWLEITPSRYPLTFRSTLFQRRSLQHQMLTEEIAKYSRGVDTYKSSLLSNANTSTCTQFSTWMQSVYQIEKFELVKELLC